MLKNVLSRIAGTALTAAVALAVIASPVMTTQAFGQDGGGGGGRGGGMGRGMGGMMMAPAISGQQIDRMEKVLKMTPDQATAARALHEGYNDQARQIQEKMRETMEKIRQEFQDTQDPSVWDGMQKQMEESRDARKKLDEGFMGDLKALLNPDQTEKWPSVERGVRRDQGLRRGFISGERVDLIQLIDRSEMPEEELAKIKAAMEEYEVEIDREIVKRDEGMLTRMKEMAEIRASGDMEKMQDVIEKGREASVRVRDVNRKYARQIGDLLAEEQKASFELAFRKESFPDVYRETQSQRALGASEKFADLTEDQKASIATLKGNFEKELTGLNTELTAAIEEGEMTFNIAQGFGGRDRGPAGDLRRERRDLDTSTLEALKKILTPEQIERLPKREENDFGGGRGGDRGGRGGRGQGGGNRDQN